jgi:hypothetical protein
MRSSRNSTGNRGACAGYASETGVFAPISLPIIAIDAQ